MNKSLPDRTAGSLLERGDGKMVYNEEHLLSISEKYAHCAELLSSAITDKVSAQDNMSANYKGRASDLSDDIFVEIEEHLKLLVSC